MSPCLPCLKWSPKIRKPNEKSLLDLPKLAMFVAEKGWYQSSGLLDHDVKLTIPGQSEPRDDRVP